MPGPVLLGLAGILISAIFAFFSYRLDAERAEAAFLQMSARYVSDVQNHMNAFGESLRRAGAFTGKGDAQSGFLYAVQLLDLPATQAGALSVGLLRGVADKDRASYQEKWANEFASIPLKMADISGTNTDAYIVEALEPGLFKEEIRGYDFSLYTDFVNDLQSSAGKDHVLLIVSKRLSELHRADFLIFYPWYLTDKNSSKLFDRNGFLHGYVYIPVSVKKMMDKIDCEYANLFKCELSISENKTAPVNLYQRDLTSPDYAIPLYHREVVFAYGGKQLTLKISSQQAFDQLYLRNDYVWMMALGVLMSLLCATVYYMFLNKNIVNKNKTDEENKKKVQDKEIELMLNAMPGAAFILDRHGLVLSINHYALALFKQVAADVCGQPVFRLFFDFNYHDFESCLLSAEKNQSSDVTNPALVLKGLDLNGLIFTVKFNAFYVCNQQKIMCLLNDTTVSEEGKLIKEQLSLAIESAKLATWEWHLDKNKISWDGAMYALYGLDPISFYLDYASWSARISRADIILFDGAMHAMLHGGESLSEILKIILPDGSMRYISTHGKLILDDKGFPERVIGIDFDMSRVIEAEYALRESGERFSLAAQAAKEGIWDWNMQTGEVWFSPQWKENFGYADDELENNFATWDRLIEPEDRKRFLHLTHEFNHGAMDRFEVTLRFKHKSGHWVSVRSRAVHLKNESGEVVRMVGSHEDITEILKHEAALNESRKRMDLTIQCAGLGIWDWNISNNEVLFGGQWAEILGYDPEKMPAHLDSWSELTHPDDVLAARKLLQAHFSGELAICAAEFRVKNKEGNWRWILSVGRVSSFSQDGKPLRMLGVNIDIHERKINEAALQAAILLAEAASRAKSDFLANMSHEIRTPLNAVLGFSSLVLESELSPQQRDLVDSIHTAGHSLLSLLNDLLDFAKIEAGRLELECIEFNLRHLIEELFIFSAPRAYEKKLEIACLVSPDVPEHLMGDPARLRQVLVNIMSNAIKFTGEGNIIARVLCGVIDSQRVMIRIEIKDSGLGLSDQVKNELFSPFIQADNSTTRKFGGTGLGLSICKRLVDAMEGQIGVESQPGAGANFWIEVPFTIVPAEPPVPVYSQRRKVLVFEPFPVYAESLAITLARLGLHAHCYTDSEEGMAALNQDCTEFAFVIMDERFEAVDLSHRIHDHLHGAALPVIHLILSRTEEIHRKVNPLNFYLAKFTEEKQLRHCIEEALQHGESAPDWADSLSADEIERLDLHILVAEDNLINQKVAMMMLQKLGCKVDVANNGLEALNQVQKGNYDLVFMDCQMPEMDGYTSVALIRALAGPQSKVPVVALTANAYKADEDRCYEAGMDDFIAKPISAEQLIRVLSRFFFNQSQGQAVNALNGDHMTSPAGNEELDKEMASINHTFEDLKTMLGMDMTDELIQLFLPTLDECLANLGTVIESGDGDAVVSCAHKLKGAAAQLGAQNLADLCKKVEQTGREKALDNAWPYHAKIMSLGSAVGQRLRER
ncbi:PAS domain-containing protein [Iodobacter sp. HSC-16F04]|uniref:histidine kinase n=1 Tax=Iodobacter violaceini TaxID=3044271 RepID=A0ABX0KW64_9NEIS|nr:PAS domain-containing hybrid sensor histidine kinase/response regulator [Iodobacter violacea]NHQ86442.1 PAS domain-containing protein [Iodobacter violacea]